MVEGLPMCGRYQFTADGCPELEDILSDLLRRHPGMSWRGGEVYPTHSAPVLVEMGGELVPDLLCWGFPWPGRRPVVNARAETLLERPMFRDAALHRRCVVPASAFYEWDSEKQKSLFRREDGGVLYLAGVCAVRSGLDCFCIVTTSANDSMREVHDRMPLIFDRAQAKAWLRSADDIPQLLQTKPPQLYKARADGQLQFW